MYFTTKLDYSDNRQVKQFQLTSTQLSGTTVFGVPDAFIPESVTADTINIDALQYIQTRGVILPDSLPAFTGSTYQLLGRDDATGKIVEVSGFSGATPYQTLSFSSSTNDTGLLEISSGNIVTLSGFSSGLEAISEGGNDGWRLKGRDAANYGNIGEGSIDFSESTGASSVMGATGDDVFMTGTDNIGEANRSVIFGTGHETVQGNYSSSPVVFGSANTTYPWNFVTITTGRLNTTGTSGSTGGGNPVVYHGINSGYYNDLYGGRGTHLFGSGLIHGGAFCTVVGAANVDITNTIATQAWSPSNDSLNPAFIVGIGNVNSSSETSPTFTRRNGVVAWRDGTLELPEADTSEIDSRGPKAVPTVEWVTGTTKHTTYAAMVTPNITTYTGGTLTTGDTYVIETVNGADDFTNVGFVSTSTPFVATGATPTIWTANTEVLSITESTPSVNEVCNSTGANVTWEYSYNAGDSREEGVFDSAILLSGSTAVITGNQSGDNTVPRKFFRIDNTNVGAKNLTDNMFIEVRIYS